MVNLSNGFHPTHSILQTLLDISPISLMLDIGNQIIERKRKGKKLSKGGSAYEETLPKVS